MAITGMEADQVWQTPKGDVSVPITWAYNHHYGAYINGKDSVLEQVELGDDASSRYDVTGHGTRGSKVWITRPAANDTNPTSHFPTATVFATGNGGEYRKSWHSYPAPYAQLVRNSDDKRAAKLIENSAPLGSFLDLVNSSTRTMHPRRAWTSTCRRAHEIFAD